MTSRNSWERISETPERAVNIPNTICLEIITIITITLNDLHFSPHWGRVDRQREENEERLDGTKEEADDVATNLLHLIQCVVFYQWTWGALHHRTEHRNDEDDDCVGDEALASAQDPFQNHREENARDLTDDLDFPNPDSFRIVWDASDHSFVQHWRDRPDDGEGDRVLEQLTVSHGKRLHLNDELRLVHISPRCCWQLSYALKTEVKTPKAPY